MLCFLITSVLRFAILPYYRRYVDETSVSSNENNDGFAWYIVWYLIWGFHVNLLFCGWLFTYFFRKFESKSQQRTLGFAKRQCLEFICSVQKTYQNILDVHQTPISTFLWLTKDEINVGKRDKKIQYGGHQNSFEVRKPQLQN